jgi:amino acid transporter
LYIIYIFIEEENDDDDGDECDGIVIDIDSVTTVIDARCNILNGTYLIGFLLGLILQACSLYVVNMVTLVNTAGSASSAASAGSSGNGGMGMSVIFALYFFSRYWALLALLLPPIVCTMSEKFHRSSKARRRANRINKKNKNKNVTTSCLETFFECVRFQFGLFFGSLILLSIVNFYTLAQTAPLCMLLAYYGVCVVVSLFALCLLQLFVNQVCANISSVEIVVSYDKDEDDDEDDDEDNDNDDDE